jgi:hypothetical protein
MFAQPAISVSPNPVNFGNIYYIGEPYPRQRVVIKNTGTAPVEISLITVAGNGFTLISDIAMPKTIEPDVDVSFYVDLIQIAPGSYTGTLKIYHNASDLPSPIEVSLTGVATGSPSIRLNKTSIDIGSFQVGSSTTGYGVIEISNTGTAPLEITSIDIDGDGFSLNWDWHTWTSSTYGSPPMIPMTISRRSRCEFDVTFSPVALGLHTGTLRIYHNASNLPSPIEISITGNGINT